jgi:hypothetical protein
MVSLQKPHWTKCNETISIQLVDIITIYYEIICIFRSSFQDTVAPKILCLLENAFRYVLKNDCKDKCHLGEENKHFPVDTSGVNETS